jgi:hypothetical protein
MSGANATDCTGQAPRVARERKTVTAMLHLYCRRHHGGQGGLCQACAELHAYAMCRLDRCPFGADKPTCAHCPVHCYRADRREQIRAVMRYAGPRMLWRHPYLAIRHLLDGRRPAPTLRRRLADDVAPSSSHGMPSAPNHD